MDPTQQSKLDQSPAVRALSVTASPADAERRPIALDEHELARLHRLASLGTLAASIAHEVNNILTPILSYAQLALSDPADADLTRKALSKAAECSAKASRIGSAMLGFVRPEDEAARVHVASAVADALACLARDPVKDNIETRIEIDPNAWVAMSPTALEQVLLNLILNAREAMRGRRGVLAIAAKPTMCSTGNVLAPGVEIAVEDNGAGMPPDLLARAFEPFVTASESGVRRGHGLGLSVTRSLVEKAGGSIVVTSRPREGTKFVITLVQAPALAAAA